MIVAITGATGFIGKRLLQTHLSLGDEVRYLTRSGNQLDSRAAMFRGDLSGPVSELENFLDGVDVLYHCAAELLDESSMHVTNVLGTENLIAAARGKIKRWVQLSSTGVYGRPRGNHVVEESSPLAPVNTYERTKLESDQLVLAATENGEFDSVILRPSNVYGPDMSNQSLFGLIRMVQRGLFFYIGKPGALANYVHVRNVVDALVLCAHHDLPHRGAAYIVSDCCTMEDFIGDIAQALGVASPRLRLPEWLVRTVACAGGVVPRFPLTPSRVDALTSRVSYSDQLLRKNLGYGHKVSIGEGIMELAHSVRNR